MPALSGDADPAGLHHLDQASVIASAGQAGHAAATTLKNLANDGDDPNAYRWQCLLKPVRRAARAEQSCPEGRQQQADSQKWGRW
ncbi:hypothetical protein [Bradyrhizobium mercantei]|uniref:hypothetical protein n=1 Tax=Bradyrhizobium mercantei TaxID=1904807 RepID=UPI00117883B5|nr:hypothetical protein [Bradyrhizobium mercantei]